MVTESCNRPPHCRCRAATSVTFEDQIARLDGNRTALKQHSSLCIAHDQPLGSRIPSAMSTTATGLSCLAVTGRTHPTVTIACEAAPQAPLFFPPASKGCPETVGAGHHFSFEPRDKCTADQCETDEAASGFPGKTGIGRRHVSTSRRPQERTQDEIKLGVKNASIHRGPDETHDGVMLRECGAKVIHHVALRGEGDFSAVCRI